MSQVRSAGEDAWLGRPAPEDAVLDCTGEPPANPLLTPAFAGPFMSKYGEQADVSVPNGALTTGAGCCAFCQGYQDVT